MISFDANILIQAVVTTSENHTEAFSLLEEMNDSEQAIALCWEVLHAFRRISTNPVAVSIPLPTTSADLFIDELLAHPKITMLQSSRDSWEIFKRYSREMKLTGNLVTDAVIASQLEANGVKKLYSNDRDFRKFSYLRVIDPFEKKKRR